MDAVEADLLLALGDKLMERKAITRLRLQQVWDTCSPSEAWGFLTACAFNQMTDYTQENALLFALGIKIKPVGKILPTGVLKSYRDGDLKAWGFVQRSDGELIMPEPVKAWLLPLAKICFYHSLNHEEQQEILMQKRA